MVMVYLWPHWPLFSKFVPPKKLVEFQFVELLSLFNIVLLKGHQMILKHFVFVIWNYIPIIILYNGFYKNSKLIQKCKEYYTHIINNICAFSPLILFDPFFPISTFKILSTFESLLSASVSMLYIIMGHLEVSYLKIFSSNSTLLFSSGSLKFPEHRQIC